MLWYITFCYSLQRTTIFRYNSNHKSDNNRGYKLAPKQAVINCFTWVHLVF